MAQDIQELVLELVQLIQEKRSKPQTTMYNINTERHKREIERHWSYTSNIYDLHQEIQRRVGPENTKLYIQRAEKVLALLLT